MIVMAKRGGNIANLRKGKKKNKKKGGVKGRPFAANGGAFSYSPRGK